MLDLLQFVDRKTVNCLRLVNRRFRDLGATVNYEFINFEKSFPQHLFRYVKKIELGPNVSPFEVAWILGHQSQILKYVKFSWTPDLIVLNELLKCSSLQEMDLTIVGDRQKWENLFQQFSADRPGTVFSLPNVTKLTIKFFSPGTNTRYRYFTSCFPNVKDLEIHGGALNSSNIPKIVERLVIKNSPYFPKEPPLNILKMDSFPRLKKLEIHGGYPSMELPQTPISTLQYVSWSWTNRRGDEYMYSLDTWFRHFPQLRHLQLRDIRSTVQIGDIETVLESARSLKLLKLETQSGPAIWELNNAFRNVSELNLIYATMPNAAFTIDLPFANFSKLKKLTLNSKVCSEASCTWLRESIYRTCSPSLHLEYAQISRGERGTWDGPVRLLTVLSEVVRCITLITDNSFKSDWLSLFSSNLKILVLYNTPLHNNWTIAINQLQERNIKVVLKNQ